MIPPGSKVSTTFYMPAIRLRCGRHAQNWKWTPMLMKKIAPMALAWLALASGCATSPESEPALTPEPTAAPETPREEASGRVNMEAGVRRTLGETIRYIGETHGGGGVLTAGLEVRPGPAKAIGAADSSVVLERLAAQYDYQAQRTPHYVFIYPTGYEELTTLSLSNQVDGRFNATRASFAVGAGTDLFNAFALLSHSVKVPVVADQVVADAWCGEVFLQDAPLSAIVEALLKSARVAPSLVTIESTDRYLLVRSASNLRGGSACLNAAPRTPEEATLLEKTVSIRVPDLGGEFSFQAEPATLGELLSTLSAQIGLPVTADTEVARLPVNISVLEDLPLEIALDLLVQQWPVPRYGYQLRDGAIHFTTRAVG